MVNKLSNFIIVLALLGVAVSGYALSHHYGFSEGKICNLNQTFNCDTVNKSQYSEIAGIPVALIGLGGYLLLAFAVYLKKKEQKVDRLMTAFIVLSSSGALIFSAYLTWIEFALLKTYCPTCLVSQTIILVITVLAILLALNEKKNKTMVESNY